VAKPHIRSGGARRSRSPSWRADAAAAPARAQRARLQAQRRAGSVWYAKYRLPDGRQRQQRIGPAWPHRGQPARGYFTEAAAKAWLADHLTLARKGTLPGQLQTGVSFAHACEEYLRWIEFDRERKPSTVRDYRSIITAHLVPAFGAIAIEDLTTDLIERWSAQLTAGERMCNRTKLKILTILHGVMKRAVRVWKLPGNPVAGVEKPLQCHRQEIDVFCPEEVFALVRAAETAQDAAIFLTAAFTGLRRGELVALRWRAVDFAPPHPRRRRRPERSCANSSGSRWPTVLKTRSSTCSG
jgi:integrase